MLPDLALLSTLIGLNHPCLELIYLVSKVFEPLKFDCIYLNIYIHGVFTENPNSKLLEHNAVLHSNKIIESGGVSDIKINISSTT